MAGVHSLVMKELNVDLVRRTLRTLGEATRQQLAEATGLSTVTVATILDQLVSQDEAHEGPLVPSAGGRPAQVYRFHPGHSHSVLVFTRELAGADRLFVRVVDLYGRPVAGHDQALGDRWPEALESTLDRVWETQPRIRALGFALPGTARDGVITSSDYPGLVGFPLVEHFRNRYRVPVCLENDVNAAAMGFARRHGTKGTLVYLYFPEKYPPGAGMVIDGRLHRGRSGWAGEVAHLPLDIGWTDPEPRSREAAIRVLASVAAVLNPHTVVLQGGPKPALTDRDLAPWLPPDLVPDLVLSSDFDTDFQDGLAALTLDLLAAT